MVHRETGKAAMQLQVIFVIYLEMWSVVHSINLPIHVFSKRKINGYSLKLLTLVCPE